MDFTAASSKVRIIVEGLPEIIYRLVPRFGSSINENTDFRLLRYHHVKVKISNALLTFKILPIALKSQRWEFIFFWFFALRTKMICTGTKLFGSFSWGRTSCGAESTDNCVVYYSYSSVCVLDHGFEMLTSKMWATVSFPSTCFFMTPSW